MNQTYDKKATLAAAKKAVQVCREARKRVLADYDAQSRFFHFFSFLGPGRPVQHRVSQQKIAERISFKATICMENAVYLTDDEIDAIKDYWGAAE